MSDSQTKHTYSNYDRENYILDIRDRIDQKVLKTLMGYYGEGAERKRKLGTDYEAVQIKANKVNRYLRDQGYLW